LSVSLPAQISAAAVINTSMAAAPRGRAAVAFAASLTFDNVTRRYGSIDALRGVSFTVEPGEVVCLLGPSGCGKTTLMRVAAGIEKPTTGRVLINDYEVAGPLRFVPPEQRGVGLMFQDFALFPHLTIVDNVAFGLKALSAGDAAREAMAVLARFGLERYAESYPHVLSGGQQQRVALARAIVPRPQVMLMDEPFSGLDVQLRDSVQEETLALLRETRATSVIVTHHPEEAMRLGNRIAVMQHGQLVQHGKAEDLYHQPAALFVARLFSEINELQGRVRGGSVTTPIGTVAAPGFADGDAVTYCIRERGFTLTPLGSTPNSKAAAGRGLSGRVLDVKFLGDVALLEIGVTGFDQVLRARVAAGLGLVKGSDVSVEVDPANVLIFPAAAKETSA
jgi:iron(III) transport system ATP-binding protein